MESQWIVLHSWNNFYYSNNNLLKDNFMYFSNYYTTFIAYSFKIFNTWTNGYNSDRNIDLSCDLFISSVQKRKEFMHCQLYMA